MLRLTNNFSQHDLILVKIHHNFSSRLNISCHLTTKKGRGFQFCWLLDIYLEISDCQLLYIDIWADADLCFKLIHAHTHTHFMTCGISLGKTGAAKSDRTQEKARLDQSAATEYKSHQPDRSTVFQKSQMILDEEQAPGDATFSDYRETSWTSSL